MICDFRSARFEVFSALPLRSKFSKSCFSETLAKKRFEPQIYADNTDQKKIEQKLIYFLMFNPRSSAEICGSSSVCKRFFLTTFERPRRIS
jgi:oligoribonuclease (3'-5' exoribonuclease)